MTDTPATIDEYISSFPADVKPILEELRSRIREALPAAEEKISYGIPSFALGGKNVVHFAGWKHHIAVYPIPAGDEAFEERIEPYRSGKGTLKFPLADPIPYDLIEQIAVLLAERSSRE